MKAWGTARHAEVRHATVRKAIGVIRAAFAHAVDAGILPFHPAAGLTSSPDVRDENCARSLHLGRSPPADGKASRRMVIRRTLLHRHLRSTPRCHPQPVPGTVRRTVHIITDTTSRELHQPMHRPRKTRLLLAMRQPANTLHRMRLPSIPMLPHDKHSSRSETEPRERRSPVLRR